MHDEKGGCKMDHSVRAYLERMPTTKLKSLVESGFFEDADGIDDTVLQDVLEVLITRNTESDLSSYIQKLQKIRSKQAER